MAGLFHTLNVGAESLYTNRQGVDTAGHNIANAQTEGYSRQRVNVTQRMPSETRGVLIGNGVYAKSITRAHDKYVEKQLNLATQDSSLTSAKHNALQPLEQIYSTEMQTSIADEITGFFNACQNLSSNPEEPTTRTTVVEAARDMVSAFNRVDFNLRRHQQDLDEQVKGTAAQVNDYCKQIAELNVSIMTMEAGRMDSANDLRDQQDKLVRELSEKIDINYYTNEHGEMIVRGPGQSLLVDGKLAGRVVVKGNAENGFSDVMVYDAEGHSGRNITKSIERGELKALIDVRDRIVPQLLDRNNDLAGSIISQINSVHRDGYGLGDYKEAKGRNFFAEPIDWSTAARDMRLDDLIAEDFNAISAAATPNAPGDNVVVNEILRLRTMPTMENGTMSYNEYYSNYVGQLGLEVERTGHQMEADKVILGDLSKRREAVSGVSLDEEAVNLLRWQTAFAASSKVITTTDEMLETVLSLKR